MVRQGASRLRTHAPRCRIRGLRRAAGVEVRPIGPQRADLRAGRTGPDRLRNRVRQSVGVGRHHHADGQVHPSPHRSSGSTRIRHHLLPGSGGESPPRQQGPCCQRREEVLRLQPGWQRGRSGGGAPEGGGPSVPRRRHAHRHRQGLERRGHPDGIGQRLGTVGPWPAPAGGAHCRHASPPRPGFHRRLGADHRSRHLLRIGRGSGRFKAPDGAARRQTPRADRDRPVQPLRPGHGDAHSQTRRRRPLRVRERPGPKGLRPGHDPRPPSGGDRGAHREGVAADLFSWPGRTSDRGGRG